MDIFMTVEFNSEIVVNKCARLSADRRTIEGALFINGTSYDIDIDFSNGDLKYFQSIIPKVQAIWANMAKEAFVYGHPQNWEMKCSYDSMQDKASLTLNSEGGLEDLSKISFRADSLKADLRNPPELVRYINQSGHITADNVLKYMDSLMRPNYVFYSYQATPAPMRLAPAPVPRPVSSEDPVVGLEEYPLPSPTKTPTVNSTLPVNEKPIPRRVGGEGLNTEVPLNKEDQVVVPLDQSVKEPQIEDGDEPTDRDRGLAQKLAEATRRVLADLIRVSDSIRT
jgi:hypothetical protein